MNRSRIAQDTWPSIRGQKPASFSLHPPRPQIVQPQRPIPLLAREQVHIPGASYLPNRATEGVVKVAVGDESDAVRERASAAEGVGVEDRLLARAGLRDQVEAMDV